MLNWDTTDVWQVADNLYDEASPAEPVSPRPTAAVADEGLYQEVGDAEEENEELYQDAAAPSQHYEPQPDVEEEYYQVWELPT